MRLEETIQAVIINYEQMSVYVQTKLDSQEALELEVMTKLLVALQQCDKRLADRREAILKIVIEASPGEQGDVSQLQRLKFDFKFACRALDVALDEIFPV